jgi:hypothetical protein
LFVRHNLMRDRSVNIFPSIFERDGEPVESVAIDVRVNIVIPNLAGNRLN